MVNWGEVFHVTGVVFFILGWFYFIGLLPIF